MYASCFVFQKFSYVLFAELQHEQVQYLRQNKAAVANLHTRYVGCIWISWLYFLMQFTKKQYQILKENKRREPTSFLTTIVGLDSLVALFAPSLVFDRKVSYTHIFPTCLSGIIRL
jgi:hypothetical protein